MWIWSVVDMLAKSPVGCFKAYFFSGKKTAVKHRIDVLIPGHTWSGTESRSYRLPHCHWQSTRGPYDWIPCIENFPCKFENPWSHKIFMELHELLCYLYHLQKDTVLYGTPSPPRAQLFSQKAVSWHPVRLTVVYFEGHSHLSSLLSMRPQTCTLFA